MALALGSLLCFPSTAQTFRVVDLGTLSGGECRPTAINAADKVALINAPQGNYRAFLQDITRTELGTLGGAESFSSGLNNADQVVGYTLNTDGIERAFLWTPGGSAGPPSNPQMQDLGTLGGAASQAYDINDSGQITGYAETTSSASAFLFNGSTMLDIGSQLGGFPYSFGYGINASGHIAGTAYDRSYRNPAAFLYDGQTAFPIGDLSGKGSSALDLNDSDQVVGYAEVSGKTEHAFLYSNGEMLDLGTTGGDWSYAQAINNLGQVVGGSFVDPENQDYRAFLYDGTEMINLNDHLDETGTGWTLIEAYDINDAGHIIGLGTFGGYDHAFLLVPPSAVPAPEISQMDIVGAEVVLGFSSSEVAVYDIEGSADIRSASWEPDASNIQGNGTTITVRLPLPPDGTRRFYRVRVAP